MNYKEQILEHLQEEQVQIMAEALQCEKGIQKLKEEQRQSILVYEDKKKKGMGINELQAFDRFLTSQTKKIEREKLRLQEIRVREEKKRGGCGGKEGDVFHHEAQGKERGPVQQGCSEAGRIVY